MRSMWQSPRSLLTVWWTGLALVSCANIGLWLVMYRQYSELQHGGVEMQLMLLLSAAYVFGCAFRSFLPRADLQRICLFDTWLSSVAVGRSVATLAEVAFVVQWALLLLHLGELTDAASVVVIAAVIVPLIVAAEVLSWYGVVTRNPLAHAVENSIWAFVFLLIGLALCRMLPDVGREMQLALVIGIIGIAGYLAFLVSIDVPMYLARWRAEPADRASRLLLRDGLRDVCTRWVVTHDVAHWRGELAWMALYFSVAVWGSLALSLIYVGLARPLAVAG